MHYQLILKVNKEVIDITDALNLELASNFFIHRKHLDNTTFNTIFEVVEKKVKKK